MTGGTAGQDPELNRISAIQDKWMPAYFLPPLGK